jgi:hypothetical protein
MLRHLCLILSVTASVCAVSTEAEAGRRHRNRCCYQGYNQNYNQGYSNGGGIFRGNYSNGQVSNQYYNSSYGTYGSYGNYSTDRQYSGYGQSNYGYQNGYCYQPVSQCCTDNMVSSYAPVPSNYSSTLAEGSSPTKATESSREATIPLVEASPMAR